jgi:predicted regulator of Ras-like GTPase activity (Roadblock/LC7/MglB family)/Tfp pilus assembly protein PilF
MKSPAPADLQRWSEDVARDATSLSFLPLARAYRRQGRRDAALRLCLRGLEHHPDNVEGHSLLAMLYFESGQRVKAYDEWSMVLTLESDNFDALRGMGFYYLEQEDHVAAKRHLERAAAQKSNDPAVQEGLRIISERLGESSPEPAPEMNFEDEPWASTPSTPASPLGAGAGVFGASAGASVSDIGGTSAPAHAAPPPPPVEVPMEVPVQVAVPRPFITPVETPAPARAPAPPRAPAPSPAPAPAPAQYVDPARVFDPLLRGGQVLGALILDAQGLVIAGALSGEVGAQAESLGAILGGAIEEVLRTTHHLGLGQWKGVLLEADAAVLHFSPVGEDMIVLLAAYKNAPTGWVLRSAHQATVLATRFLEMYS